MKKLILSLIVLWGSCILNAQTTYYVIPNGTGTTGASWADALGQIAKAIEKAATGDQIFVATGTYPESWGALKKGVSIYGGFKGDENSIEARPRIIGGANYEFQFPTVVSVNGIVINNTTSFEEKESLWIDGVTFKECSHDASLITIRGGMNFRNCSFINNQLVAPASGAGTNNLITLLVTKISDTIATSATLTDCLFEGNRNAQNASIMMLNNNVAGSKNTSAILENAVFKGNITDLVTGSTNANVLNCGGADGSVLVQNVSLYNNQVKQAIFNAGIATQIVNCMVYNNTCGTNHVLLAGAMVNTLVTNNTGRFCFNNNDYSKVYNSIIIGNAVGLAPNNNITNFQASNNAINKEISTGSFKDNIIVEDIQSAEFIKPTTFVGAATNATQLNELMAVNWNIKASSPLINGGLTSWFTATTYGASNNFDITASALRYYVAATNVDFGAYEATKNKLTIGMENPAHGTLTVGNTGYYMPTQSILITAAPAPGYRLSAWKDASNQVVATTAAFEYTMPNAMASLTAHFVETNVQYNLRVEASEGGSINIEGGMFFQDQAVALVATPSIGYRFKNWTDDLGSIVSIDPVFSYAMPDREALLTANFELKPDDLGNTHAFDFEGLSVNSQWQANDGSIAISNALSQSGTQSLLWTTDAKTSNKLTINLESTFTSENTTKTCYFTLYNSTAIAGGKLYIRFLAENGTTIHRVAVQGLDFVGWREFERRYGIDFSNKAPFNRFFKIEFELENPSGKSTKIYIDKVNLQQSGLSSESMQTDWSAYDAALFNSEGMLKTYAHSLDATLPIITPTSEELLGASLIRSRFALTPRPGNIEAARTFVKELGLKRNSDGIIVGKPLLVGSRRLSENEVLAIATRVETLGHAALTSPDDKQLHKDYLDYIIEQGFIYKTVPLSSSNYALVRDMGQALTRALVSCQNKQQSVEWARLTRWIMAAGQMYDADHLYAQESDVIYNYSIFFLAAAAYIQDDAVAIRELKGVKRYMEHSTEVTPGSHDIMKPDGTGFHHATHYPNYMYSYRGWCDVVYKLRGTPFRVQAYAYENFKKAAIAMAILATRGDNNYIANSMAGRNPFNGYKLMIYKSNMEELSQVGGDIYGKPTDEKLDEFINYQFNSTQTSNTYDGFYAFNWSPAGVYRHGNWVATMRAPTTKFWGTEIYISRNRLGRYQSHGTLEVLYNYQPTASGYPSMNDSGWDWNVVPGGTTVHYTQWAELLPSKNVSQRFDQFTKTKNFAGALPLRDCGIFASDFDQGDNWSVQCFVPTGLEFKKSVFAFDGKLISLGSNITATASPANTSVTATNLFQSYKPTTGPNVNGTLITPSTSTTELTSDSWIITPEGTGYYIPTQGNDKVTIHYGNQSSPRDDAANLSSPGTAVAAKAYINHGITPTNRNYHFLVVPSTNSEGMQTIKNQVGSDGGSLYTINSQDATLHSLTYKPLNTTAYAFFEAKSGLTFGNVTAAASELLLIEKTHSENLLEYSICNPNLRPKTVTKGWEATPTETSITVKGVRYLADGSDAGFTVTNNGSHTTVATTLVDGLPKYFKLSNTPSTSVENPITEFRIWTTEGNVYIAADEISNVSAYGISGQLITQSGNALNHTIALNKGSYILRIQTESAMRSIKVIVK